jgi:toxin-antitoxin system PIN domain toxin
MRALLDVNVLIALLDAGHLHHHVASEWLARELDSGWASCPLTQNGCLRILAQPAYPGAQPVALVAERLAEAMAHPSHAFWPDSLSLLDRSKVHWSSLTGHRQVTDVYLLALAVSQSGRFVTFDARMSLNAVVNARREHLVVLGAEV